MWINRILLLLISIAQSQQQHVDTLSLLSFTNIFKNYTSLSLSILPELICLSTKFSSHFSSGISIECTKLIEKNWEENTNLFTFLQPSTYFNGAHIKVWEKKDREQIQKEKLIIVSLRHQEDETIYYDEMQEAISIFASHATVDWTQQRKPAFGVENFAKFLRFWRQLFGLDWFPRASQKVKQIIEYYQNVTKIPVKIVLSGASFGGFFAHNIALSFNPPLPAIAFGGNGVEDFLLDMYPQFFPFLESWRNPSSTQQQQQQQQLWYPNPLPVFNFFHLNDPIPRLDCQVGYICYWKPYNFIELNEKESEKIHLEFIFGNSTHPKSKFLSQFKNLYEIDTEKKEEKQDEEGEIRCMTGVEYGNTYGTCRRERSQWEKRMKSSEEMKSEL